MKLCTTALLFVLSALTYAGDNATFVPNSPYDGPVVLETVSVPGGLDDQKLTPRANLTTWDWWYWDAVSTTSVNESIAVTFYDGGPAIFGGVANLSTLFVQISVSFKNGTLYTFAVPATDKATITSSADGVSASYDGTGMAFSGNSLQTPGGATYTLTFDSPDVGMYGTATFKSLAPPHYACYTDEAGVTEIIVPPLLGWANAQPDAHATVDITFNGTSHKHRRRSNNGEDSDSEEDSNTGTTELKFSGYGYHDKNWGIGYMNDTVSGWYWGHAHLGPYSVVWFDTRDVNETERLSGYVAKDGVVLNAECGEGAVLVRPWGANSTYPPKMTTGPPEGFLVTAAMGPGQGTLTANFTRGLMILDNGLYQRYIGDVEGGVEGGETYQGRALCEELKVPPSSA